MDSAQGANGSGLVMKPIPNKDKNLRCPRCSSTNTKFCYYNNYNLNQPRYLCKTCKRYWTQGGSLRNVPFGGGSRKSKKTIFPKFLHQNPSIPQTQTQFLEMHQNENNISIYNQHDLCFGSSGDQVSTLGMNMMMHGNKDRNPCVQSGEFCFQENGEGVVLSFGHLYKPNSNAGEGDYQIKGRTI